MPVFKDWDDYQKHGKTREEAYNAEHVKSVQHVHHKKFGEGVFVESKGDFTVVSFTTVRKSFVLLLPSLV